MSAWARLLPLLLLLAAISAAAETIRVRADEWCPVNCAPGSERPGYMIEMARAIAGAAGHAVDYRLLPWPRALAAVRAGRADCVVGAYPHDAPDFRYPKTPWGYDQTAVYAAADAPWQFETLEDLLAQRIGVIGGYAYGGDLNAFIRQHPEVFDIYNANNALRSHIRKLLAGRLTGVVESEQVMRYTLADMGVAEQVRQVGRIGAPNPMFIACSPHPAVRQDLTALFETGFQELRDDGRLQAIRERYGLPRIGTVLAGERR